MAICRQTHSVATAASQLSILPTAPLSPCRIPRDYTLTYNGEIYNSRKCALNLRAHSSAAIAIPRLFSRPIVHGAMTRPSRFNGSLPSRYTMPTETASCVLGIVSVKPALFKWGWFFAFASEYKAFSRSIAFRYPR